MLVLFVLGLLCWNFCLGDFILELLSWDFCLCVFILELLFWGFCAGTFILVAGKIYFFRESNQVNQRE